MAQMTEHFKAPEKIQLSKKEIANLADAQFKTLVIKKLTELVEFVQISFQFFVLPPLLAPL